MHENTYLITYFLDNILYNVYYGLELNSSSELSPKLNSSSSDISRGRFDSGIMSSMSAISFEET